LLSLPQATRTTASAAVARPAITSVCLITWLPGPSVVEIRWRVGPTHRGTRVSKPVARWRPQRSEPDIGTRLRVGHSTAGSFEALVVPDLARGVVGHPPGVASNSAASAGSPRVDEVPDRPGCQLAALADDLGRRRGPSEGVEDSGHCLVGSLLAVRQGKKTGRSGTPAAPAPTQRGMTRRAPPPAGDTTAHGRCGERPPPDSGTPDAGTPVTPSRCVGATRSACRPGRRGRHCRSSVGRSDQTWPAAPGPRGQTGLARHPALHAGQPRRR
jgi:hypothetical protein